MLKSVLLARSFLHVCQRKLSTENVRMFLLARHRETSFGLQKRRIKWTSILSLPRSVHFISRFCIWMKTQSHSERNPSCHLDLRQGCQSTGNFPTYDQPTADWILDKNGTLTSSGGTGVGCTIVGTYCDVKIGSSCKIGSPCVPKETFNRDQTSC